MHPVDKRVAVRFPARHRRLRRKWQARGWYEHGAEPRHDADAVERDSGPGAFQGTSPRSEAAADQSIPGCQPMRTVIRDAVGRLRTSETVPTCSSAFAGLEFAVPRTRGCSSPPAKEAPAPPPGTPDCRVGELGDRCRLAGHKQSDILRFHHALDLFVPRRPVASTPNVVLGSDGARDARGGPADVGGTRVDAEDGVHWHDCAGRRCAPPLSAAIVALIADPAGRRALARAAQACGSHVEPGSRSRTASCQEATRRSPIGR